MPQESTRMNHRRTPQSRNTRRLLAALLLCTGLPLVAHAEVVAAVASPGNVLNVEIDLSKEGRVSYRVQRNGKPVITDSLLGLRLRDGAQLFPWFKLRGQQTSAVDDTWEQPWGESRTVRNHYNELRTQFAETGRGQRRMDIVFRVFDDGVGFRYEFPKQPRQQEMAIQGELTEFTLADPKSAKAWWIPAGEWNRYEQIYRATPVDNVGIAHTPMTVKLGDGTHVAFHEAALVDYSGMWLQRIDSGKFRAALAPSAGGAVLKQAPFHTPWRTIQIAADAGKLYESSNLILNLNEPNKLGDVSWFKPAKYVGVWWGMHLDTQSWGIGPKHGATTEYTTRMIDFAAQHGFRGVLVEGWNVGWDKDWFANGWVFDFLKPTPDFDLEKLAVYARSKGVHLIGHHETACAVSHYERQMKDAFALYERLGIDVVKTGYVCDAGQIERQDRKNGPVIREWHDSQWNSNHHLRVVTEAAKRHIAINPHEPIKDTGLRRTYPNWIAREGARGMEYNAWGEPPNPPEHEAMLVFTRMLSGPMDFTPGVLSLVGKNGMPIQTTLAKQLALYVVLYSPVQMAPDLPENYEKHMDAFQFIKDVPADWETTRVPNGEVGDYATIVRKDRNSADWYLGSVTDENPRTLKVELDFLEPGKTYEAQIYRDAKDSSYQGEKRFRFEKETRQVTAKGALTLRLAPGGGQAIRFMAPP
jgi:alpha-glucosidase